MFGARLVACLLMVATVGRVCHSQSCLETESESIYNQDFVSERAVRCMDQGTGVDLVAGSKCECARRTEEADLNTFRYSEDGCRAFQAVPVAVLVESRSSEEEETVELYVAAEPTGDTTLPPDNGPTVTGLTFNILDMAALVAEWGSVGDDYCRAVSGYSVEFSSPTEVVVTTDLTATLPRTIDPVCGDYTVAVTARDGEGNDYGTPAVAVADLPPAYKLECCSPPFVVSAVGCVYPVSCTMTFDDAREVCKSYGADLYTSPNGAETKIFSDVVKELSTVRPVSWIGVQKVGDDFAWLGSGRPVDAKEWEYDGFPACPITDALHDCGYIVSGRNGPVCNTACTQSSPFFCSAPTVNPCGSGPL